MPDVEQFPIKQKTMSNDTVSYHIKQKCYYGYKSCYREAADKDLALMLLKPISSLYMLVIFLGQDRVAENMSIVHFVIQDIHSPFLQRYQVYNIIFNSRLSKCCYF